MGSNISELVKSGHEIASDLKASCGAVDVRSVAQLISDLASQLEVQLVRSNTLAAENVGLNKYITQSCYVFDGEQHEISDAYICATDGGIPETPSTDAFLAEVRASALPENIAEIIDSGDLETICWQHEHYKAEDYRLALYRFRTDRAAQLRKRGAQ
ncbi:hypothetical protein SedNR2807_13170 [Citrobacter sedlakii]